MALTKISGEVLQQPINLGVSTSTTINVGTGVTIQGGGATFTGVVTATTFSGNATSATLATNAQGLTGTPNITVGSITAATATFSGNISVAGTVTYEDVTNVDSVGVITARSGLVVGAGASVVGVVTATGFVGNVTGNVTGNVNATGLSTFSGGINVGATASIIVGDSFIKNNAVGLGSTTTTGRNAGVGTALGTLVFNTTRSAIEYYNGSAWISLKSNFDATGGTISFSGGKTIHTFTSSGTFTVNFGSVEVEYLVVAGGGGGGFNAGSGGGAGGFRTGSGIPVNPGPYTVTVGGGGNGSTSDSPQNATNGTPSIFSFITSAGGGYGSSSAGSGNPGGSGGGSSYNNPAGTGNTPPSSPPQGNPGGVGNTGDGAPRAGGGGGGAGGAGGGTTNANNGGVGGNGTASSISGSSITYAGGGGGASHLGTTPAAGGPGGGGPGGKGPYTNPSINENGTPGTVNLGGGGGAGSGGGRNGGNGGSGIVIIAYST